MAPLGTISFIHSLNLLIQMKRANKLRNPVIINLQKTPRGYEVENQKMLDTKKSNKLTKYSLKQQFMNPENMHKTQHQNDSLDAQSKLNLSYKTIHQNNIYHQGNNLQLIKNQFCDKQIPPRPTWFDILLINQKQKDNLPQFFEGNSWKTPSIYKKYRNFIVNIYEENPQDHLSKTTCRRIFHGDACSIQRIHTFLQKQGIINRGIFNRSEILFDKKLYSKIPERQTFKNLPPKLLKNIQQSKLKQNLQFQFKPNFTSKILSKACRTLCFRCKLPIGLVWLQSKISPEMSVCIQCFNGFYGDQKQEFEKHDVTKSATDPRNKNKWQMDEHGKLLSSLSEPGVSWQQVLDSIPNKKPKQEIIFHFIQLPSTNIDKLIQPKVEVSKNNESRLMSIIQKNYQRSVYSKNNQVSSSIPAIEISPVISQITNYKLQKFIVELQATKQLDEINYKSAILPNPAQIVSRIRMLRNYQIDRNQNFQNFLLNDSAGEIDPINNNYDNLFQNDFQDDNFGNFEEQDDGLGGIFNVLND